MTPEQARKLETKERRRAGREQQSQARKDHATALRDCRWAMKMLYPKDLAEIRTNIKKQAKLCATQHHAEHVVTFSMPNGLRND